MILLNLQIINGIKAANSIPYLPYLNKFKNSFNDKVDDLSSWIIINNFVDGLSY